MLRKAQNYSVLGTMNVCLVFAAFRHEGAADAMVTRAMVRLEAALIQVLHEEDGSTYTAVETYDTTTLSPAKR